jgi:hypothetical protein
MMMVPARVAYVLKVFPRLSETFILNEILELERQGIAVEIFSLNPPRDPRFHAELAELGAHVTYLPRADSTDMRSQLRRDWADRALWGNGEPDDAWLGASLREALQQAGTLCCRDCGLAPSFIVDRCRTCTHTLRHRRPVWH